MMFEMACRPWQNGSGGWAAAKSSTISRDRAGPGKWMMLRKRSIDQRLVLEFFIRSKLLVFDRVFDGQTCIQGIAEIILLKLKVGKALGFENGARGFGRRRLDALSTDSAFGICNAPQIAWHACLRLVLESSEFSDGN